MTNQTSPETTNRFSFRTLVLLLLPILLLTGVIFLFLQTGGGLNLESPVPIEDLTIERYQLERGHIQLHVQNTGPGTLTIAWVIVNEAVMPFDVTPSAELPRLGRAVVSVEYAWTEGEAYAARIFSSNAVPFDVEIPVAYETPQPEAKTFWSFTLIGIYVDVIPIFLGIFDWDTYLAFGFDPSGYITVPNEDLMGYPIGATLHRVVVDTDNGQAFLLVRGERIAITNEAHWVSLHLDPRAMTPLTPTEIAQFPLSNEAFPQFYELPSPTPFNPSTTIK